MVNNVNSSMESLLRRIQELSFAKTEAALYLDVYPDSKQALDYFKKTLTELDAAMTEYQNKYGPLFKDAAATDRWSWIDGPWPWQLGTEDK